MVAQKQPPVISRTSEIDSDYKWGFVTDIEADIAPKGLNEDIVRLISAKKGEPEWMTEWRLKAYRYWMTLGVQGAALVQGTLPADRLPGHPLLLGAQEEGRRARRASTRSIRSWSRRSTSSASRSRNRRR